MYWVSLESVQKLAQIIAVGVGGWWVYFNSISSRLFEARLQLTLSGQVLTDRGKRYVLVTMQTKNVGQTLVKIAASPTILKLTPLRAFPAVSDAKDLVRDDMRLQWFEVLDKVTFKKEGESVVAVREKIAGIEPGVAVDEQRLFLVPSGGDDAFALEFRVGGLPEKRWWDSLRRKPRETSIFTAMAIAVKNASSKAPDKPS